MGSCMTNSSNKERSQSYLQLFTIHSNLGMGRYGKVEKVIEKKTNKSFALKTMSKAVLLAKKLIKKVQKERQFFGLLRDQHCDFIVNMEMAFQDKEYLYLVTEIVDGKSLRYYLEQNFKFNEEQARFIAICILKALNCLHSVNIIHHDLRPKHILIDSNGYAKLLDLTSSDYELIENSTEIEGEMRYMPPQVLKEMDHDNTIDFYSLGVLLFELQLNKRPYDGKDSKEIIDKIHQTGKIQNWPQMESLSPNAASFISNLLDPRPLHRLGKKGIYEIVQHPWINMTEKEFQAFQWNSIKSCIPPISYEQNTKLQDIVVDKQYELYTNLLDRKYVQEQFQHYDFHEQKSRTISKHQS